MTDPRFDPRFQRGWNGPEPVVRAAPTPQPVVAFIPPPPVVEVTRPETPVDAVADEQRAEPSSRFAIHNPARLVLLIGGIVLLIAAVATLNVQIAFQQQQNADPSFSSMVPPLPTALLYSLPQPLCEAGLISLIVWLALGALDAGARRAQRSTEEGD